MLDKVRFQLEGILTSCNDLTRAKELLKGLVLDIKKYSEENTLADMHNVFRVLEEYDTYFRTEVKKYANIPQNRHKDRAYQVSEILTITTLIISYLSRALRKYNVTPTETNKGTAKVLRQLNEMREQYRNEKISWGMVLKAETAMIADETVTKEIKANGYDIATLEETYDTCSKIGEVDS